MVPTVAYIALVAVAGILSACAPLWMALIVFLGAITVAFKPELKRSAFALPYSMLTRG